MKRRFPIALVFLAGSAWAQTVPSGLMAQYDFLQGSGTTLTDQSGNGNSGTLCTSTAAPTWLSNAFSNTTSSPANGIRTLPGTGGLSFTGSSSQCVQLPVALNSLASYMIVTNWNPTTGSSDQQAPIAGTINGTALQYNFEDTSGFKNLDVYNIGASEAIISRVSPIGVHCVGVSFDTIVHVYMDGQELSGFNTQNALTQPSSGNYQLGGSTALGNFFTGSIFYFAAWNRVLSHSEHQQMCGNFGATVSPDNQQVGYLTGQMQARGVTPLYGYYPSLTTTVNSFLADGDSLTAGLDGTPYTSYTSLLNGTWQWGNIGLGGSQCTDLNGFGLSQDTQAADVWYSPTSEKNAAVLWCGTNDMTNGASVGPTVAAQRHWCTQRRIKGFKCFLVTMLSRTGEDTNKNSLNAEMRKYCPINADGCIDLGELSLIGADGASANPNIFNSDNIHPLTATDQYLIAPYIFRVINRYFGNTNFSTANTYSSATAAGTAITAATESGNIATFTSTLNPGANVEVSITGVAPTGYNQPCYTQTSTASNFTCFNTNTGLGSGSVFGTAQVPSQVDADQYIILNYGGGNFLLESCSALTGQRIYIKNINASSSTVVPSSNETIDGSSSVAVATKATLVLEGVLTGASSGGCSWKQAQNN